MPRRHPPEPLSPRALARLRASPRSYVPTELDLEAARPVWGSEGAWERGSQAPSRLVGGDSAGAVSVDGLDDAGGGRHVRVPHPRAWVRLPAAFVGARWQPGRAALVGVVIVVALAVAVFGLRVAWARSADSGTVIAPGGGSRAGPSAVSAGAVPVGVSGSGGTASAGTPSAAKRSDPRIDLSALTTRTTADRP